MTNLSDTQRILLSTAAQRDGGSLLPPPSSLKPGGGTAKAITALVKHSLAVERETNDPAAARRSEGDIDYGVFVTPAGSAAIGIDPVDKQIADANPTDQAAPATDVARSAPRWSSKTAAVIALLTRVGGATLPDLIAETGWLPHTTRAALTGLRKKGHTIIRDKREGVTCYRIVEAA